jgi:DNA-binding NarL/FixJ family response regulator
VKVMLVEDHPVFLDGLVSLIQSADIDVVGTATSVAAALALLPGIDPDVVVVDVALPDGDGAELTAEMIRQRPELRVLVLTMFHDDEVIARALDAGASGYLVKDAPPQEIVTAIRSVSGGSLVIGSAVADRLRHVAAEGARRGGDAPAALFPQLRARERQVLGLMADGLDNTAIATRLGLSTKTVANYVSTILTQLQVPTRSDAAKLVRSRSETGASSSTIV